MARFRYPVSRSDPYTDSSTRRRRPAKRENTSKTRSSGRSMSRPASHAAAIAPALIIGLRGAPVSGSRLIALNASPLGSTPMRLRTSASPRSSSAMPYTSGFEDRLQREVPPRVARLVHGAVDRNEADAEPVRVGVGQLGDVRRHDAVVQRRVAAAQPLEVLADG
jgi:hypothetical protein